MNKTKVAHRALGFMETAVVCLQMGGRGRVGGSGRVGVKAP